MLGFKVWTARIAVGVVALAATAAAALLILDLPNRPGAPDLSALKARAQAYHADIRRDSFGVPHVRGRRDADVAFGLGYAHSEDDYHTIETTLIATRGTLAARDGVKSAVTDYLVQWMGVWPAVDRAYDAQPEDLKAVLKAYADGVNLYAAQHPEKVAPGVLPVTAKDIAAGFAFKTPFFYGLDAALTQLTAPTAKAKGVPVGSNGAAVAPSRAADGATRLLVNSHQPYTGPVAWYEAVLDSGEGWHVAGGFFPGSPFMLHGHNEHLGWANTVNAPDLVDIYKLAVNPADKTQYRLDGAWRSFQRSEAKLRLHLWGPFYVTVTKPILRAAQGPVMETDHGVFAVRYAGHDEGRQALQYYRLDKAQTLEQWRAAMALQLLPSINYLYADEKGNIGYVYNGQYPVRKEGLDWSGVLPGDRSDLIWTAYLPFDKTPQIWNPRCGLVFNSNNTPFTATACADDGMKPQDYSPTLGIQTNMTNRAWRALENFGADPKISEEAFNRYKFDIAYSPRSSVGKMVVELTALDPKGDADLAAAQQVLKRWNGRMDVANTSAALVNLTTQPILSAGYAHKTPPTPLESLKAAIAYLKTHYGRLDPPWGELNRIRRGKTDLAIDGGADTYRSVWGRPGPDGKLTAEAGDTYIMFVAWDRAGKLTSRSIHQFGSATLDDTSPHYADQTPLFVREQLKPVWFSEEQLKGHVERSYAVGGAR